MKVETWCPQCGPNVVVDDDECCVMCGASATGDGVDMVHALYHENEKFREALAPHIVISECLKKLRIFESTKYATDDTLSDMIDEMMTELTQLRHLRDEFNEG